MVKEKQIEFSMAVSFVLLALYLIATFTSGSAQVIKNISVLPPLALVSIFFQLFAGIAFLVSGVLLWIDSRRNA